MMPKDEEERTPAEDYLAQLDWQSKQNMRRRSWDGYSDEPNWKFRIIRPKQNESENRSWALLGRLLLGAAVGITGLVLYRGFAENPGRTLFLGIVIGIVFITVILAVRDGSTKREDPGDMDE
jgi:hypothetical protein